jgi:hypothetical protein
MTEEKMIRLLYAMVKREVQREGQAIRREMRQMLQEVAQRKVQTRLQETARPVARPKPRTRDEAIDAALTLTGQVQRRITETQARPRPQGQAVPRYADDDALDSILRSTQPFEDASVEQPVYYEEDADDYAPVPASRRAAYTYPEVSAPAMPRPATRPVNIVAEDIDGKPVNPANPAVKKVLELMNMDYRGMLQSVEERVQEQRQAGGVIPMPGMMD